MKSIKIIAVAAMMMAATGVSAQFTNTGSRSSNSTADTEGWSTLWVEFNPGTVSPKKGDGESFTGLSIGYSKAFSLSANIPLFLEAGVGAQYSFKSLDMGEELDDDYYEYCDPSIKYTMISAKIPVNFMYAWQIPNSSVTLMPFVGINMRFNIVGNYKFDWNWSDDMIEYFEDRYGSKWEDMTEDGIPLGGIDRNLFDEDDMGKNGTWNRFQIGWHIGVKARFGKSFMLGAAYGGDFSEVADGLKVSNGSISVGYTF